MFKGNSGLIKLQFPTLIRLYHGGQPTYTILDA